MGDERDSEANPELLPPAEVAKLAIAELQEVNQRFVTSAAAATTIIQFIIVGFAAGVVAADKEPAAIVSIPVFWSVWMLHALRDDYDRVKLAFRGAELELQLNQLMGIDVPVFRTATDFICHGRSRPLALDFQYAYWAAINIASWIMAAWIVYLHYHIFWVWLISIAAVVILSVTGVGVYKRIRVQAEMRAMLPEEACSERKKPAEGW